MKTKTLLRLLRDQLLRQLDDSKQPVGSITISITLTLSIILTLLLLWHDLCTTQSLQPRSIIGIVCVIYLTITKLLLARGKPQLARWMIVAFAALASSVTLTVWGIHTAVAMLTLSLLTLLPGIFFGSRYMPYTIAGVLALLLAVQALHSSGLIQPRTLYSTSPSLLDNAFTYSIPLAAIFSVTWVSIRRSERAVKRARYAEKRLRTQKLKLKAQLQQESARLKSQQLKEIEQLYGFAVLGQDTVATLHELSNHLTVLGMDIDGLAETSEHTDAINSAKNSLSQINRMIHTVRSNMNPYSDNLYFTPYSVIRQVIADLNSTIGSTPTVKLRLLQVKQDNRRSTIYGNPGALAHIVTILVKNSIEACSSLRSAKVHVLLERTAANIQIIITDSGRGMNTETLETLFTPLKSSKPTGLGVGLYIARSLTKTQFKGSLRLISNRAKDTEKKYLGGATFALDIPHLTPGHAVAQ